MKDKIKKILSFLLNPRLIICVGIAWLITNGWSYIMMGIGTYFGIGWMIAVSGAYLAFLWLPFTPEKLITALIAIALLRFFFPSDEKTLAILRNAHQKAKNAFKKRRSDTGLPPKSEKNDEGSSKINDNRDL